jgi:endoglucanase
VRRPAALCFLALRLAGEAIAAEPGALAFWERQRKGANCQNQRVGPEYWKAAADVGLEFVRLLPDAWPTRNRDFLMGSADGFTALDERDLAVLVRALGDAHAAGVKVVLAPISLPGARWKQLNGGKDDGRLWRDAAFQGQAEAFWRQLAGRLRGHPAIAAYNPLNEPHPERAFGFEAPGDEGFAEWHARAKGTPADLDAFNRRMVAAIRSIDPDTPILLDGWFYASPAGLSLLEPVEAEGILYSFHFYDPWEYSTFRVNQGRWSYPERLPGPGGKAVRGGADAMREQVAPVLRWARARGIPASRIAAAEFGVDRRVGGAQAYLENLVRVLNEHGWHWAFYAFRGDGDWTGLDYEIGFDRVDPRIWDAAKRGEDPERYKRRHDNPLWQVLRRELAGRSPAP